MAETFAAITPKIHRVTADKLTWGYLEEHKVHGSSSRCFIVLLLKKAKPLNQCIQGQDRLIHLSITASTTHFFLFSSNVLVLDKETNYVFHISKP